MGKLVQVYFVYLNMVKKKCSVCKEDKKLSEFALHSKKGIKSPRCRVCQSKLGKQHYNKNKSNYIIGQKIIKDRNRKYLWEYLKNNSCVDCGETDPIVLEFDHLDRENKLAHLSIAVRDKWSIIKINEEIKKCQVLCANCHRRKSAKELGYYKDFI